MRRTLSVLLLAVCLSVSLGSCERCGPEGEPSLVIQFRSASTPPVNRVVFSQIRSLNGTLNRTDVPSDSLLLLPLSLTTDSTAYVFVQPGRTDTLTVRYRRSFSYQSTKCGYVLDLAAPTGKAILQTTFPRANAYLNYEGRGIFKSPGPDVTGINVDVQL